METLVTGHIEMLSQSFLDQLSNQTELVLSADDTTPHFSGKKIKQYQQSIRDDEFLDLFSSYSFDAVVFFLSRPESMPKDLFEMEKLERVLDACAQKPIKKVIVVSSTYVYRGIDNPSEEDMLKPSDGANIRLSAIEELCRTYRETYHVPITVLRTSCLFGKEETVSYVGESLKKLVENDQLVLEGRPDQVVEFLSLLDLGKLIERIVLEPQKDRPIMNVSGTTRMSLQQFADVLKKKKAETSIRFTGKALPAGPPIHSDLALTEYRWKPAIDFLEEVDTLFDAINDKHAKTKRSLFSKVKDFYHSHSFILIALELIAGFFLMEYLVDFSETIVQFRVIDFRLLFVVLFAGAHGPQIGLIAALIASFSTYTSFAAMGIDWRIIFYNVDNWIPFAVYFITAWILGYVHDRYKRDLQDAEAEVEEIASKQALLKDLYLHSLERKTAYEKQIISYNDSFGKIYHLINRLENAEPASYFYEALGAVEVFLENQTISFYVFKEQSQVATRYVCSSKAVNVSPERLKLDEYPEFRKFLMENEVWVNKNQLKGYPDYAIPIYKENHLAILITIHEAAFEQMSPYYENLFKITGYLVSTTFEHKLETNKNALTESLVQTVDEASSREEVRKLKDKNLYLVAHNEKTENK